MTRPESSKRLFLRRHALTAAVAAALAGLTVTATLAQPPAAPPTPDKAGRPLRKAPAQQPDEAQARTGHIRFGSEKPIPKPDGALRIAVYNIENLFDDHDDPALTGRVEDKDMTKPEPQRRAAAEAIRAIDADVLGLVEVESERAVAWFRDEFLKDMGYEHIAAIDAGDERGIEQVVLSRYPVSNVKNWPRLPLGGTHPERWGSGANREAGKPITFHRSPLQVTVTVPAAAAAKYTGPDGRTTEPKPYEVTLLVVHQKSGGPGGYWREREAIKTVDLVRQIQTSDPDANVIIMGDFNARPDEKAMKPYLEAGLIDLFGHRRKGDPTYITHESGRPIDVIFLTPAVEKELIRETRFILGTPARPAGADWRVTPGPEGYASDHYPVVMDLVPADR